jgi:hypothetical protein
MESSAGTSRRLVAAATEIDQSLLEWSLSLSLRERLRVCSNAARALAKFKRAKAKDR